MKKLHKVPFTEVVAAMEAVHTDRFDISRAHAERVFELLKDHDWCACEVAADTVRSISNPSGHKHGDVWLIPEHGTIHEACSRYDDQYRQACIECHEIIERARQAIREGKSLGHIFLEETPERIKHVDGLHRMIAWTLEGQTGPMQGYIAVPRDLN